jgi:hypothetical protein
LPGEDDRAGGRESAVLDSGESRREGVIDGFTVSTESPGRGKVVCSSSGEPVKEDDRDRGVPIDEAVPEGDGDLIFSNGDDSCMFIVMRVMSDVD